MEWEGKVYKFGIAIYYICGHVGHFLLRCDAAGGSPPARLARTYLFLPNSLGRQELDIAHTISKPALPYRRL